MQEKSARRSNAARSAEMRELLLAEARHQFAEKGYADTSTPDIVRGAGVTRGALYHHFADKAALFDAVLVAEAEQLVRDISSAASQEPGNSLNEGSKAFFASMSDPGRTRLLLLDGPSVLGHARMDEIDAGGGRCSLLEGLEKALPDVPDAERAALAKVLSSAFDRAALAISDGEDAAPYIEAMERIMKGLMG